MLVGVLKKVIEHCVDGASCREISEIGDKLIIEECGKVFKKEKELKRGSTSPYIAEIACSVNNRNNF